MEDSEKRLELGGTRQGKAPDARAMPDGGQELPENADFDKAVVDELHERRASMTQARKARPWWTAVAGAVPLLLMGYLVHLLESGKEIEDPVLVTLTIATFSSFVVIHSVILIGLYGITRSDASQGHLWSVIRQLMGKGQDPSP